MARGFPALLSAMLMPFALQAAPFSAVPALPPPVLPSLGDLAMSDTLAGLWTVTEVTGATVPPDAAMTLEFDGAGGLAGRSG